MQYRRFEDLPVWQEAIELARVMTSLPLSMSSGRIPDSGTSLSAAALSVSNNIAEGFERGIAPPSRNRTVQKVFANEL